MYKLDDVSYATVWIEIAEPLISFIRIVCVLTWLQHMAFMVFHWIGTPWLTFFVSISKIKSIFSLYYYSYSN